MLGADADYDVVPYFFSDLADWASLEYVGPASSGTGRSGAATARTASSRSGTCRDGRVAGCLSVGRSEDLAEARRLLAEGVDVSRRDECAQRLEF